MWVFEFAWPGGTNLVETRWVPVPPNRFYHRDRNPCVSPRVTLFDTSHRLRNTWPTRTAKLRWPSVILLAFDCTIVLLCKAHNRHWYSTKRFLLSHHVSTPISIYHRVILVSHMYIICTTYQDDTTQSINWSMGDRYQGRVTRMVLMVGDVLRKRLASTAYKI